MLRYLQPRSADNSPNGHPAKRQRTNHGYVSDAAPVVNSASTDATPAGSPHDPSHGKAVSETVLRKIQSVERHFGSQHLQTPHPQGNALPLSPPSEAAELAAGEAASSPGDGGFVIHCSQVYQRTQGSQQPERLSQADSLSAGKSPSGRTQSSTPSHDGLPSGPQQAFQARSVGDAGDRASVGPDTCAPALATSAAATPELSREDAPGCSILAAQSPGRKLFPLFRPTSERKVLHLIRHGQSTFNAATVSQPSFSDPTIYDARLTERGQAQCTALRKQLSRMAELKGALWIVSPLTRALETFQLGCPYADRLQGDVTTQNAPELMISSIVAEHCATSGDVGSPASQLRARFPAMAPSMAGLPERWWFRSDVNCATKERMGAWESMAMLKKRVGEFRTLLQSQQHKVIVCVGHSTFFKEFMNTGRGTRLRNCEVHTQYL